MILHRCCLPVILVFVLLLLAACNRNDPAPQQLPPGPINPPPGLGQAPKPLILEEKEPHMAGKKVFNAHGCGRCHTMGGPQADQAAGGPPGGPAAVPAGGSPGGPPNGPPAGMPGGPMMATKGPDLAKVAGKSERDVEWFIAYVGNPRKEKA